MDEVSDFLDWDRLALAAAFDANYVDEELTDVFDPFSALEDYDLTGFVNPGRCPLCHEPMLPFHTVSRQYCCGRFYHYQCHCAWVINFLDIDVRCHHFIDEETRMVHISADRLKRLWKFGVKCPEAECDGFDLYQSTQHYLLSMEGAALCPPFLLPDIPVDMFRIPEGHMIPLDLIPISGNPMEVSGPSDPRLEDLISGIRSMFDSVDSLDGQWDPQLHMQLYTIVYNMCRNMAPVDNRRRLYVMYMGAFEEYINKVGLPALKNSLTTDGECMLREFITCWKKYELLVKRMSGVFHYLHRCFVMERFFPDLVRIGNNCFRDQAFIVAKPNKVGDAVAALIDREREGEAIDRALVNNVMDVIDKMGYIGDLETYLLQKTAEYYSRKASRWISEDSCLVYITKAEECLRRERNNFSCYMRTVGLKHKLVEKVKHELLAVHATKLLGNEHDGCAALLRDNKVDDMITIYGHFHEIPEALSSFINSFTVHVAAGGLLLVQEAKDAATKQVLVQKLIQLYDECEIYADHVFVNPKFHEAIDDGFGALWKIHGSITELLVQHLEMEGSDECEDKIMKLVACIPNKFHFSQLYEQGLAKRLLSDQRDLGSEIRIIEKMSKVCRGGLTFNMELMVKDMNLSKEFQTSFEQFLLEDPNVRLGMKLKVKVLTPDCWPYKRPVDQLRLPEEMVKCVKVFEEFYNTKKKNRKLVWNYSLGTCNVIGYYEAQSFEFVLSPCQAAVLLLFNHTDRLSYSEISAQLNLTGDLLDELIISLSSSDYEILTPSSDGGFQVNRNFRIKRKRRFTSSRTKIQIPPPRDIVEKARVTDFGDDKKYQIDCSILRVMKSCRVLECEQLVITCVEELWQSYGLKAEVEAIERRVKALTDRGYMVEDEAAGTYRYIP